MNSGTPPAAGASTGKASTRAFKTIASGLALVAVVVAFWDHPIRRHYIPAKALACANSPTAASRNACLSARFHWVTRTGRLDHEFEVLREMVASGWLPDCHQPAHLLGTAAFEELGSGARALAAGKDWCSGGYVHAVAMAAIPAALKTGLTLPRASADLCGQYAEGSTPWGICMHGVGHGAFVAADSSYEASLALCATLAPAARDLCSDGTAMQNSMRFLDRDSASYEASALTACTGLELSETDARKCNEQIGEIAVFHFNHRLIDAEQFCVRLPDAQAREWCVTGVEGMQRFARPARSRHWHDRLHIPINPKPPAATASHSH